MALLGNQDDIRAETPMSVDNVDNTSVVYPISAETVTFYYNNAGTKTLATGQAAGTLIYAKLGYDGVLNSLGTGIGNFSDTSFAFITGTVLTTKVAKPGQHFINDLYKKTFAQKFTAMAEYLTTNGEYFIDHEGGAIWGLSAAIVASDTCNYAVKTTLTGGGVGDKIDVTKVGGSAVPIQHAAFGTATPLLPIGAKYMATPTTYDDGDAVPILTDAQGRIALSSDIQIGAVELKDGASDTRAEILAPNVSNYNYGLNTMPARYMASPPILSNSFASPLLLDSAGRLVVSATGTEYLDDSAGFVVASSKGSAIMGLATTDTVNAGDIGALAMSTSRELLGKSKIWDGTSVLDVAVDDSAMPATPKTIPVSGEYRSVDTVYTDGDTTVLQTTIAGHLKTRADGYDTATDSMKSFEISPLDQHYVAEKTVLTNIASGTTAYVYYDLTGYRHITIQGQQNGGASVDTITVTVEASCQDDGTAAASCTYQDITAAFFGAASWVDTDFMAVVDQPTAFKYVRVKYVTAGGTNDADLTLYSKKMF